MYLLTNKLATAFYLLQKIVYHIVYDYDYNCCLHKTLNYCFDR